MNRKRGTSMLNGQSTTLADMCRPVRHLHSLLASAGSRSPVGYSERASGRVGERAGGRAGERASGRAGERARQGISPLPCVF